MSAIGKVDYELKSGAELRSSSIYLTDEENTGKPQLRDSLMNAV